MGAEPSFELVQVSRRYGRRWALAQLSFRLEQGESLLLTGHNSSGKTTLLRLLATALMPSAGQLRVMGQDPRVAPGEVRRQVGLVSHASFLYEDLTARQNLALLVRLLGLPDGKHAVERLLERVGLGDRAEHPVRHFSAGMRKRLAIARLLAKRPRLAPLDEPFGELDPRGISQMEGFVRELQAEGTSVVLATHLIDQGLTLCRRRLHLHDGRLAEP